ncbi:MAG: DUF748 domain-containing protein [Gammaproteobacteria bacterium]|nr:DUF748 domain-containing protein [Gammaproteobacteria bacterium]
MKLILNEKIVRKIVFSATLLIGFYSLAGFLIAPSIVKGMLVDFVADNSDAILQIKKIRINPFTLTLEANEIQLSDRNHIALARVTEVVANLQVTSVFTGVLTLSDVIINEPLITVNFTEGEYQNSITRRETKGDKATETPEFDIGKFQLLNGKLLVGNKQSENMFSQSVNNISLSVNDIGNRIGNTGEYSLSLDAENAGRLSVKGAISLFHQTSIGEATLSGARVEAYAAWIPDLRDLSPAGTVDLNLNYAVERQNRHLKMSLDRLSVLMEQIQLWPHENLLFDLEKLDVESVVNIDISDSIARVRIGGGSANMLNARLIDTEIDKNIVTFQTTQLTGVALDTEQKQLEMSLAKIENGELSLSRDNDGQIDLYTYLSLLENEGEGNSIVDKQAESSWLFTIEKAMLDDIAISINDKATELESTHYLTGLTLNVSTLSNLADSSSQFELQALLNQKGKLSLHGWFDLVELKSKFDVSLEDLELLPFNPYLREYSRLNITRGKLSLQAQVKAEEGEVSAQTSMDVSQLEFDGLQNDRRLAAVEKITVANMFLKAFPLSASVELVELNKPFAFIEIDEASHLNVSDWFTIEKGEESGAERLKESETSKAGEISVARMNISDGSIDFQDLTLSPGLRTRLTALNGDFAGINLAENAKPVVAELDGRVGEFGVVNIKSQLLPADPTQASEINMSMKNIDTSLLSPYAGRFAGRAISSGKLDLDLDYKIKSGTVAGENSIILKDLILGEQVESKEALDLPLDMAIALLQDKNGKIDVSIPVSGDLNNPKFDLAALIRKAIGNMIGGIVKAPFKALGNIFGGSDKDLDGIPFEPGIAKITPPAAEVLQTLKKILDERPALGLKIKQGFDPVRDRQAIAALTLRERLQAETEITSTEFNSGPLLFSDPRVQKVILRFAKRDFSSEDIELIRQKRAIPELGEDSEGELQSEFYKNLYAKLVNSLTVAEEQLKELSEIRSQAITDYLLAEGITVERISLTDGGAVKSTAGKWVAVELELVPLR